MSESKLSKIMDDFERQKGLFRTPPHIVRSLLRREQFPGTVWEPAAGKGDIVRVLLEGGYREVLASDIYDWGFRPCRIEDFLTSSTRAASIITNPLFDLKWQFLAQAKRLADATIALLLPLDSEYRSPFLRYHESDTEFPWKALYAFTQQYPQNLGRAVAQCAGDLGTDVGRLACIRAWVCRPRRSRKDRVRPNPPSALIATPLVARRTFSVPPTWVKEPDFQVSFNPSGESTPKMAAMPQRRLS